MAAARAAVDHTETVEEEGESGESSVLVDEIKIDMLEISSPTAKEPMSSQFKRNTKSASRNVQPHVSSSASVLVPSSSQPAEEGQDTEVTRKTEPTRECESEAHQKRLLETLCKHDNPVVGLHLAHIRSSPSSPCSKKPLVSCPGFQKEKEL